MPKCAHPPGVLGTLSVQKRMAFVCRLLVGVVVHLRHDKTGPGLADREDFQGIFASSTVLIRVPNDWRVMSSAPDPLATPSGADTVDGVVPSEGNGTISSIAVSRPMTTCDYLARRLNRVFNDLGLLPHIPGDWLQPSPEGLGFRPITVQEADKLVLAIEDLAHGYKPPRRSDVNPDQLRLFPAMGWLTLLS